MEQKRYRILFITKWFLHRNDPQFAVFVSKHAEAISAIADVAVLHVMADEKPGEKIYDTVITEKPGYVCVQVYFRKKKGILFKPFQAFRYFNATRKGLQIIQKNFGGYDLVHAYILLRPAVIAWWLKITKGEKYIISEQWSGYATGKFAEKNLFARMFTRFIVKQSSAVTTVSGFLEEKMKEHGLHSDFFIIPNIIEVPAMNEKVKQPGGPVRILVVADLVDEIKNISGTIRAFSAVRRDHSNLQLDIIGHGKDEVMLKDLVRNLQLDDVVFFHGVKSNKEVYDAIMQCDFVVMNSNFETFSLICAEALACGKPVIATRCGGPQEFIDEAAGILIDPGSREQLISAIKKMTGTFKSYPPDQLKQFAASRFSSETVSKKFLGVYQQVLGEPS
ncbi:MAG: glycosyltransferase [Bacteroidetes bacterium]|nr:glycosyltransferase [Bacteroidota bacterium]